MIDLRTLIRLRQPKDQDYSPKAECNVYKFVSTLSFLYFDVGIPLHIYNGIISCV